MELELRLWLRRDECTFKREGDRLYRIRRTLTPSVLCVPGVVMGAVHSSYVSLDFSTTDGESVGRFIKSLLA